MSITKRTFIYILLPILFIGIIYALSAIPGNKIVDKINSFTFVKNVKPALKNMVPFRLSRITETIQNLTHVPIYSVLAVLLMKLFNKTKIEHIKKVIYILLIILVLGALDELHQHFVPGRTASFLDIFLDVIGGIIGLIIYRYINLRHFGHCEERSKEAI